MRVSKHVSIMVLTLALVVMATGIGYGQAVTDTLSFTEPLDRYVFVDCADGGAGEFVHLTGNIHSLVHMTQNPTGGLVIEFISQPQGVTGIGMTTGDKYQGTGISRDIEHISGFTPGYVYTDVTNFRIIGSGPGNNFMYQEVFHYTFNAQGELTAWVEHHLDTCQ